MSDFFEDDVQYSLSPFLKAEKSKQIKARLNSALDNPYLFGVLKAKTFNVGSKNMSMFCALTVLDCFEEFKSVLPILFNVGTGIDVYNVISFMLKDDNNIDEKFVGIISDYIKDNNIPISNWGGNYSATDRGLFNIEVDILEDNDNKGFDLLLNSNKEILYSDIPSYFNVMMSVTDSPMRIINLKEKLLEKSINFNDLNNHLMRFLHVLESKEIRHISQFDVHEIDRTSYSLWESKVESLLLNGDLSKGLSSDKIKIKL